MEKTVQITIASTQFQVTESAYTMLRSYLDRLSAHFGSEADGAEIVRDIESRIAEKFIDGKHRLITDTAVAAVIAEIGDASALSDSDEPKPDTSSVPHAHKRLYRDMDNAYLGGVAAGLAAYVNIDPLWIRLAFLVSVFTGGAGILIYLILWLLIPEAKSASQKLEMSGTPVNLDTIAKMVKERFEEAEKSGVLSRGAHALNALIRRVFTFVGRFIGGLISFGSFVGFIGASVLLGIIVLNWNAPWNDIPHKEFIAPVLLKSVLAIGYVAIVIPLIFVFALGQRLLRTRAIISTTVGFGLMGIWALSLIGCGILGTKIAGDYYAYTSSSPDYAQTVDEHAVEPFSTLDVQDANVTVRSGVSYAARIAGKRMDMDNASTSVRNGVLTITSIRHDGPCIFCNHAVPSITITVPALTTITARSSSLSFDKLSLPALSITAQNTNLNGSLNVADLSLVAENSWSGLSLTSKHLTLDSKNARLELEGTTDSISITAHNSFIDSESLRSATTSVDAQNSSVHVWTGTLNVQNDRASDVQNAGTEAGVSDSEMGRN